jgi:1-acyl-sn-glycerol-3-phosphate acyltransferase
MPRMGSMLEELTRRDLDPSDLSGRDPEFIERVGRPFCAWLRHTYFRTEHEGIENVPREAPFIAIANHSGGPMLPDVWPMFAAWWDFFPLEQPAYALVHEAAFRVPVVRNALIKLGALRASRENAERVIASGGVLLLFPGGDPEALRSFWKRNTIDFRGHTFFVELALRHGVPILPVVNVGGSETAITVLSSERLARWTGMRRLLKVKRLPINVGLPWGVWPTALLPFLPLPAKISYKVGEPFRFPQAPDLAEDPEYVRKRYEEITDAMQGMVDELAARRRFPVIG